MPIVNTITTQANVVVVINGTCVLTAEITASFLNALTDTLKGAEVFIDGAIPKCTGQNGRAVGDRIDFITRVIQTVTVENADDLLDPSKLVATVYANGAAIAETIAKDTGVVIVVEEARIIEEPSSAPTTSPAPSVSQNPTQSQKPTYPTNHIFPSSAPSVSPTTGESRTFNIVSSFPFDNSDRSWCLQASNMRVGSILKVRPCRNGFNKQLWYLDNFDQLRLRSHASLCVRWNRKQLNLGSCSDDGSTKSKAQFVVDDDTNALSVQKKKIKNLVGVRPDKKYDSVRLFVEGADNDSLGAWSLQMVGS